MLPTGHRMQQLPKWAPGPPCSRAPPRSASHRGTLCKRQRRDALAPWVLLTNTNSFPHKPRKPEHTPAPPLCGSYPQAMFLCPNHRRAGTTQRDIASAPQSPPKLLSLLTRPCLSWENYHKGCWPRSAVAPTGSWPTLLLPGVALLLRTVSNKLSFQ